MTISEDGYCRICQSYICDHVQAARAAPDETRHVTIEVASYADSFMPVFKIGQTPYALASVIDGQAVKFGSMGECQAWLSSLRVGIR